MKLMSTIPAVTAAFLLGGASLATASAQDGRASTYGSGAAIATDNGAAAIGQVGGNAVMKGKQDNRRDRDRDRRGSRSRDQQVAPTAPNSTSTYGTGAVYTDRNSTSAAVSAGGAASGPGQNTTSTTVDAYGETTNTGTSADIYGNSTATSGTNRR